MTQPTQDPKPYCHKCITCHVGNCSKPKLTPATKPLDEQIHEAIIKWTGTFHKDGGFSFEWITAIEHPHIQKRLATLDASKKGGVK